MAKKVVEEPKLNRWDLVFVTWTDAGSHDEWTNDDETSFEAVPCFTVGFVYRDTDKELVITSTRDTQNDNVCCTIIIPKGMVHKVEPLRKLSEDEASKTVSAEPRSKGKGVSKKPAVQNTKK